MSQRTSRGNSYEEPRQRFYPPQGARYDVPRNITSAPMPDSRPLPLPTHHKRGDASYLMHRHPMLLKRLYSTSETLLDSYPKQSFLYDAYPDYLSLRLMRDRLLKENRELTEEFLQSGCPIVWLELLTDTVLSELLCKKRSHHLSPMGEARTTSERSASLS